MASTDHEYYCPVSGHGNTHENILKGQMDVKNHIKSSN